jgi:hypothetical protein
VITVPDAALAVLPLAGTVLAEAALGVDPPALLLVVLLALLHAATASSTTPSAVPILPTAGNRFTSDPLIIIIISCFSKRLFDNPQ